MLQLVENGMPTKYLDEEGLSHVVDLAKKKFADKKELWNWQKTEKAGAVAFTPVPDSVLEPVVEFKFKETLPAEGEKGPDNPSTIEGVSSISVTRCGRNILTLPYAGTYSGQLTYSVDNDGSITINGTTTSNNYFYFNHNVYLKAGTKLYIDAEISNSTGVGIAIQIVSKTDSYNIIWQYLDMTRTIKEIPVDGYVDFRLYVGSETNLSDVVIKPYYAISESIAEYESPLSASDANYSVSLGNTYYGGSIDLNTGLMTVTWYANVFNGTELWYLYSEDGVNQFLLGSEEPSLRGMSQIISNNTRLCSHFSTLNGGAVADTWWTWGNLRRVTFDKSSTEMPDLESWKSWVASEYEAGHPLTIAYQLYEPFTVQLTPQQIFSLSQSDKYKPRINTIYTDAESIQVGYQKFTAEGNFVHIAGDETISGVKTFQNNHNNVASQVVFKSTDIVKGTPTIDNKNIGLIFADSTNNDPDTTGRLASLAYHAPNTEDTAYYTHLRVNNYYNSSGHTALTVGYDKNNISYATAPETTDERNVANDIITRGYLKASEWNWQKTKKDAIVQFEPVSESSLEPIVDFLFTEIPPAEGEKGPNNPSTIVGVSNVSIVNCGKNLFSSTASTQTNRGVTLTNNGDGTYTLSGEADSDGGIGSFANMYLPAGTYTLSGCPAGGSLSTFYFAATGGVRDTGSGATFVRESRDVCGFWIEFTAGTTFSNLIFKPQLEIGSTVTSFEPYSGSNYIIPFEDTYYGGSLDVSTGVLTIKWQERQLVKSPTQNYSWKSIDLISEGLYRYQLSITSGATGIGSCSHLPRGTYSGPLWSSYPRNNGRYVMILPYATAQEADAWIQAEYEAGHPVTIAFEIGTPYTVQLTPTQVYSIISEDKYTPQLNTVYTDQESVQVGYQRFVDDENAVHKTGNETIDGVKTIANTRPAARAGETVTSLYIRNPEVTRGVPHPTGRSWTQMLFLDANGEAETNQSGRLGMFELVSPSTASPGTSEYMQFSCYKYTNELSTFASLRVGYDSNGTPYSSAPETSNERTEATDILTRGWRITEDEIDEMSF